MVELLRPRGTLEVEPVTLGGQRVEFATRRWTEEEFQRERQSVLNQNWPGGTDIDFDEAIAYHKRIPPQRRKDHVMREAQRTGKIILTPRLGYGRIEENIKSLQGLEREVGIGAATVHIDSYTRWHQFEKAAKLLEEEYRTGQNRLNGYAFAYYGYQRCREVLECVNIPIGTVGGGQGRGGQLSREFEFAAGGTYGGGFDVSSPFTYDDRKSTLEEALWRGMYGLNMAAWYRDRGVTMGGHGRGCNSGTGRPPSITMALLMVDLLTVAAFGFRDLSVRYYQHGSFLQDIAYLRAVAPLCTRYLRELGYPVESMTVTTSHYEGAFPKDPYKAMAVLCYQALTARLGGAQELHAKSMEEGAQIPTHQANLNTCKAMQAMLEVLGDYRLPEEVFAEETEEMEFEMRSLVDHMLELGKGDILRGFVLAIKAGTMEFPFSPNKYNAGRMMLARDATGAARFLDVGGLPLPDRAIQFHKRKLAQEKGAAPQEPWELVMRSIRNVGALRVV